MAMTYRVDETYCDEEADHAILRKRLLHLSLFCLVIVCLFLLATVGPADAFIEG